jgi:hypothetical protein
MECMRLHKYILLHHHTKSFSTLSLDPVRREQKYLKARCDYSGLKINMSSDGLDMYVMEHASKSTFWVLAISITCSWFATVFSAPQPPSDSNSKSKTLSIRYTKWLTIHLTSHFRKFFAISIYVCVLVLQFLEGWWVLQTNGRLLEKFFSQFPYRAASWPLIVVWATSAAMLILFAIATLLVGIAILSLQLLCIAELVTMVPGGDKRPQKMDVLAKMGVVFD